MTESCQKSGSERIHKMRFIKDQISSLMNKIDEESRTFLHDDNLVEESESEHSISLKNQVRF